MARVRWSDATLNQWKNLEMAMSDHCFKDTSFIMHRNCETTVCLLVQCGFWHGRCTAWNSNVDFDKKGRILKIFDIVVPDEIALFDHHPANPFVIEHLINFLVKFFRSYYLQLKRGDCVTISNKFNGVIDTRFFWQLMNVIYFVEDYLWSIK